MRTLYSVRDEVTAECQARYRLFSGLVPQVECCRDRIDDMVAQVR